jgi:hypothetical protein
LALTITLEDESGSVIDRLFDPQNFVLRLAEGSASEHELALLRYVDAYSDTIFNRAQMTDVLRDVARITTKAMGDAVVIVEKLRELAERCASEPHLYLKFYGD